MEYKRIFKDGSNLLVGYVGSSIIGLVNLMILTRILTTTEMGKYSLFLMVVNLALTLGLNWSDASILRHGREEYVKHKKINQSFWARFYLFTPILILISVLAIVFRHSITSYIGIESKYIFLVLGFIIFSGLLNYIIYALRSIDQMKKSAYILFFQKLIYMIGLLFLAFNLVNTQLTIILIFLNVSFLIILLIHIMKFDFKFITPYKFNKKYFKKIWSFSWPQLLGFSGLYVIHYVDLFVIRQYLGLANVGIYSVAYTGFTIIQGAILIINSTFMPLLTEYRTKKRFDLIHKYMRKIPYLVLGWTALVIIGLLLSNIVIPLLFTDKYIQAIPSFNILLITSIISFVSICLIVIMNTFDFILSNQITNIIAAGINIAGDFILVPRYGIIGAAYATMIALFVSLLIRLVLIYNRRHIISGKVKLDD